MFTPRIQTNREGLYSERVMSLGMADAAYRGWGDPLIAHQRPLRRGLRLCAATEHEDRRRLRGQSEELIKRGFLPGTQRP